MGNDNNNNEEKLPIDIVSELEKSNSNLRFSYKLLKQGIAFMSPDHIDRLILMERKQSKNYNQDFEM